MDGDGVEVNGELSDEEQKRLAELQDKLYDLDTDNSNLKGAYIEKREGEDSKCLRYCDYAKYCQYNRYNQ